MCARKAVWMLCVTLIVVGVLAAGCGGEQADVDVAGNKYVCSNEDFDSRTIDLKADGTVRLDIVTSKKTRTINGTYEVEGNSLELTLEQSEIVPEFSGKTVVYEILYEGKDLLDPDGVNWFKM